MTKNVKPLLARAKDLRPDEKLALVNAVVEDLDLPDPAIEEAWAIEAGYRLTAMQHGRMRSHPLSKVLDRYR